MKSITKEEIEHILNACVIKAIERVRNGASSRPFHEALLTKQIVLYSSFERSFSTSFGQGPIEEISKILALSNGFEAVRQKESLVNIYKGANDEIERILSDLRSGSKNPDWKKELQRVLAHKKGDTVIRRVISDLWLKKEANEIFISIKTVKPNLDQTEIAKRDLLLLKAHNSHYETYFGLFYNPGGNTRGEYNWTIPFKLFDMKKDPCVLIGNEYWDFLGGKNTYSDLLKIFATVGKETREQIQKLK